MITNPGPITNQLEWLPVKREGIAFDLLGLPAGFDAYLKILHPIGVDRSIPITAYSFAKRTIADLNTRAAFWDKYGIANGKPEPSKLENVSYREIAASLGIAYNSEFNSETIQQFYGEWPPHLGSSIALEEAFVQQIIQILGPETETYFYGSVEEGTYHLDNDGLPVEWLQQGVASDLLEVYRRDSQLPTYLFAVDHSWCLYQGEWIDWVAVGCSAHVTHALMAHPSLEVFRLSPLD
ncbi:hypothetical protein GCM10022409_25510 [Hymenobacter glaciei]|uniref:SMI1/KNR4 family protein n=1 Tax=Hymenobacter glaciei TaxID=877209 RepID=A0ABP7UA78_9BACT